MARSTSRSARTPGSLALHDGHGPLAVRPSLVVGGRDERPGHARVDDADDQHRPAAITGRWSSVRQSSMTAAPATPHAEANWSMRPHIMPTYSFSARCAMRATLQRWRSRAARRRHRPGRGQLQRGRRRQAGTLGQGAREEAPEPARPPGRPGPSPARCRRRSRSSRLVGVPTSRTSTVSVAPGPVKGDGGPTIRAWARSAMAISRSMAAGRTYPSL